MDEALIQMVGPTLPPVVADDRLYVTDNSSLNRDVHLHVGGQMVLTISPDGKVWLSDNIDLDQLADLDTPYLQLIDHVVRCELKRRGY